MILTEREATHASLTRKLREASIERIRSAPLARAVGTVRLVPEATLEGIRQRNAFLDWLFYDIGKLTDEEAREVSPWLAAEGALLFVAFRLGLAASLCVDRRVRKVRRT